MTTQLKFYKNEGFHIVQENGGEVRYYNGCSINGYRFYEIRWEYGNEEKTIVNVIGIREGQGKNKEESIIAIYHNVSKILAVSDLLSEVKISGDFDKGWQLVPKVPTTEMLDCIVYGDFKNEWQIGKEFQMKHGISIVPLKSEYESAFGKYITMLKTAEKILGVQK